MLEHADEMQVEARSRMLEVNTYPALKDDIGVYVFTEEELKEFARETYKDAYREGKLADGGVTLEETFTDYWETGVDLHDKIKMEF